MWSHLKEKFIQGEQLPSAARSNAKYVALEFLVHRSPYI